NFARSPTCSRTAHRKLPAFAVQLTRLTWAATVIARAALPGEPTRYPLSPPLEICEPSRLLLVAYSRRSNRPEPPRLSRRRVMTQVPGAGGCVGFQSYILISPCRSPFRGAGPSAALYMKMRPSAASLESTGSPVCSENVLPSGRCTVTLRESRPSYHRLNSMASFRSPASGV